MSINLNEINYLAVFVAALAALFIGGLWYGPLFSQAWIQAQGWSAEKVAHMKANLSPARFFGGMIASYLVLAFILAALASAANVESVVQGIFVAGAVWLATAAVTFTHFIASDKQLPAYLIDTSCELVYFLLMGAIIGGWR